MHFNVEKTKQKLIVLYEFISQYLIENWAVSHALSFLNKLSFKFNNGFQFQLTQIEESWAMMKNPINIKLTLISHDFFF